MSYPRRCLSSVLALFVVKTASDFLSSVTESWCVCLFLNLEKNLDLWEETYLSKKKDYAKDSSDVINMADGNPSETTEHYAR